MQKQPYLIIELLLLIFLITFRKIHPDSYSGAQSTYKMVITSLLTKSIGVPTQKYKNKLSKKKKLFQYLK